MKFLNPVLTVALCFSMTGCTLFTNNNVESIQVVTDTAANGKKITRIDFVFVYGSDEEMPKTVNEWFKGERARVLNPPENLKVVTVRVPAGLIQEVELPSKHGGANTVLAYVDFEGSGDQAPLDLTRFANPVLMIEDDHYKLSWRR